MYNCEGYAHKRTPEYQAKALWYITEINESGEGSLVWKACQACAEGALRHQGITKKLEWIEE